MAEKHIHNNPFRGRLNAGILHFLEDYMDYKYGKRKRAAFKDLPETVVEIGSGAGANLRYFPPGTQLIAIEPNAQMHELLRKNAAKHNIQIDVRGLKGEDIDLESDSVEAAVSTLVLCTVDDPQKVVSEILRILKTSGRFIFFEHVAAPSGSKLRSAQNFLFKPWRWMFEGCNLNRETNSLIYQAGFSSVDMDCFVLTSPFVPISPHIFGTAVK
jgi:SAM-dependent methyltransferase